MESVILFDTVESKTNLLPLTYTRPLAEIRVGINTITEKWKRSFSNVSFSCESYLASKYFQNTGKSYYIRGNVLPSEELVKAINNLSANEKLVDHNDKTIAFIGENIEYNKLESYSANLAPNVLEVKSIDNPWDIFVKNSEQIKSDFNAITHNRQSAKNR